VTDRPRKFDSKQEAREAVWDLLASERAARFPFPARGRIPNFSGAEQAARRLLEHRLFDGVQRIKVNPDAPQRAVRLSALQKGITVIVPTPRLRGGFQLFDPERIPEERLEDAATLSRGGPWAKGISADALPPVDLIVTGCVAVTPEGKRCGKGHGYGDLEYGIFRELGYPEVPVLTSVHELQVVDDFPADPHDLPVWVIATPERIIEVAEPRPAPRGIDWSLLSEEDLEDMPMLKTLRPSRL
jgi:5-formyltetrahydrofolate cyclo-ligase